MSAFEKAQQLFATVGYSKLPCLWVAWYQLVLPRGIYPSTLLVRGLSRHYLTKEGGSPHINIIPYEIKVKSCEARVWKLLSNMFNTKISNFISQDNAIQFHVFVIKYARIVPENDCWIGHSVANVANDQQVWLVMLVLKFSKLIYLHIVKVIFTQHNQVGFTSSCRLRVKKHRTL